jgi:hypothetical protein
MPITNTRALALQGHADQREQQARATHSLRSHPLAMDPATVKRLCAESLQPAGFRRHCAVVLPFTPPTVHDTARDYLALTPEQRPAGTINRLAMDRGHDFKQLLTAIGELQQRHG